MVHSTVICINNRTDISCEVMFFFLHLLVFVCPLITVFWERISSSRSLHAKFEDFVDNLGTLLAVFEEKLAS